MIQKIFHNARMAAARLCGNALFKCGGNIISRCGGNALFRCSGNVVSRCGGNVISRCGNALCRYIGNAINKISVSAVSERGALTLESAFVAPLVIFTVCLSIYITLVFFEQAQSQTAIDYSAHRVTSAWRGNEQTMKAKLYADAVGTAGAGDAAKAAGAVGAEALKKPADGAWLYHRIIDPETEKKQNYAAMLAKNRFDMLSLDGYTRAQRSSKYNNGIFGKTLSLVSDGVTTVPNVNVTGAFGLSERFNNESAAKSLIPDFAENIRCIDYVMQIEKKIEEASPEFAAVVQNFSDVKNRIQEYIGGIIK